MNFNELKKRIIGAWNVLFNIHKFIGSPDNNCPCYDKYGNMIGFWSRSTAVVSFAFALDPDGKKWHVLCSQRGTGTPDPEFIGAWNVVCGYLDKNETRVEAVIRETKEETGVELDGEIIKWRDNDDPKADKRQNLTYCYFTILPFTTDYYEQQFSHIGNEKNEVGEIKFIPVGEVDSYKWAFGHDGLIKLAYKEVCKKLYDKTF